MEVEEVDFKGNPCLKIILETGTKKDGSVWENSIMFGVKKAGAILENFSAIQEFYDKYTPQEPPPPDDDVPF